ncbi:hypothetical protein EV2_039423 [Malus domestica]
MMNARSWDDEDENAEHPETLSGEKKRPASLVGLAIDMAYPPRYIGFASVIILLCAVLLTAKAQTALNCATVFHEFSFCMSFVRGLSSGPLRQCCDSIKPLNAIARHDEGGPKMICECIAIECWTNKRVESEMNLVESVVKSLRSLAKESRERHPAFVIFWKDLDWEIIRSRQLEIKALAHLSSLTVFGRSDSSFCTPTESTEYAIIVIDMAHPPRYIGFASVIILLCAILLAAKAQTALNCATVFHEFSFCKSFAPGLSSEPLKQCCDSVKTLNTIARHDEGGPQMICECIGNLSYWSNVSFDTTKCQLHLSFLISNSMDCFR